MPQYFSYNDAPGEFWVPETHGCPFWSLGQWERLKRMPLSSKRKVKPSCAAATQVIKPPTHAASLSVVSLEESHVSKTNPHGQTDSSVHVEGYCGLLCDQLREDPSVWLIWGSQLSWVLENSWDLKQKSGNRRVGYKPGKRGLWSGDAGLAISMHRCQELNIIIHFYSHVSLSGLLLLW